MILITGPGRSGTTFLVQLLTRLGLDTGYEPFAEPYAPVLRAGCEWRLEFDWAWSDEELRERFATMPRVVKGPDWSFVLKVLAKRRIVEFESILMPVRDLWASACSRIDVGLYWHALLTDDKEQQLRDQETILACAVGYVVEACVLYDLPLTILHFPRIVRDVQYLYDKLGEAKVYEGSWEQFEETFYALARPRQVKQWSR